MTTIGQEGRRKSKFKSWIASNLIEVFTTILLLAALYFFVGVLRFQQDQQTPDSMETPAQP